MTRYRPTPLPIAIRGDLNVTIANAEFMASYFGPSITYRLGARTFDRSIDSEAGRQAIWSAIRGPESADDAARAAGADATWVRLQLEKRAKYLRAIATRLGLTASAAAKAQADDLEPVPGASIRDPEAIRKTVQKAVAKGVAKALRT